MSKVVVFGTAPFAQCVQFYLTHDSPHEVVAFTAHRERIPEGGEFSGLPVVPFEDLERSHPPGEHAMFVAIAYARVNRLRAEICAEAKAKGYELVTYLSSKATHWGDTRIGENCFVFEDNTIQPFVTIGDDVILWSGNHVGHHSRIGDHCFVTSHVVISGLCTIGAYSFIGVNATLRDGLTIGESNVIGSGAIIMRDTADNELYVPQRTRPDPRRSDEIGM